MSKILNVRLTIRGNGTILFGQGVDATTVRIIAGCTAKHRLPAIETQIPYVERIIAKKIEEKHKKMTETSNQRIEVNIEEGIYTAAFESITDLNLLRKHSWGDGTFNPSLTYFKRKILPRLDCYGYEIDMECIKKIQEELVQIAVTSNRGNMNPIDAENSVRNQMYRANYIYQRLREYSPYYILPDLDLEMGGTRKKAQQELPKALPDSIRIMLSRLLYRLSETTIGGLALGVALMFYAGTRPAEAAAVNFSEIKYYGTYGTLLIYKQEKNRVPTIILKSKNAYRCIILPKIMLDLISIRKAYLINQGLSSEYIDKLPITYSDGDPNTLTRSQNISALGKKLLRLCGYSDQYLSEWYEVMRNKVDKVDEEIVDDVSAYILRRDWTTRACDVCGLKQDQVDYLLGHANSKKKKNDYLTPECQSKIAYCLERYVYDPEHTGNPAFSPVLLNQGDNFDLDLNQAFLFVSGNSEKRY